MFRKTSLRNKTPSSKDIANDTIKNKKNKKIKKKIMLPSPNPSTVQIKPNKRLHLP